MKLLAVVGMTGLLLSQAQAEKPARPKKAALQALLKTAHPGARLSELVGDAGGGRFVVIYNTHREGKQGAASFWVGLVAPGAGGALGLAGEVQLPTKVAPFEDMEPIKWGVSALKDYDGDGKLELLVVYGYNSEPEPGTGDTYYRALALVNLDPAPALALQLVLDELPQATVYPTITSKWQFAKASKPAEVTVTTITAVWSDAASEKVDGKPKKALYRHDPAKDVWLLVK